MNNQQTPARHPIYARMGALASAVRRALPGGRVVAATLTLAAATPAFAEPLPAVFPLATLFPAGGGDGSAGFVLRGVSQNEHSGFAVGGAGDVNGDGLDDLIIGGYGAFEQRRGRAYVVFGTAEGFPAALPLASLLPDFGGDGSTGFVLRGNYAIGQTGSSVSAAGDVNGDGIDDLIVGAQLANPDGVPGAGVSYVVFGRDAAQAGGFPAVFPLEDLLPANGGDGSAGFVLRGAASADRAGASVSAAGDVNGDGVDDLVIGAPNARPYGTLRAGQGYVVFGRDTGQSGDFPAVLSLARLLPVNGGDGSAGFVINGIHERDASGSSVSRAGDINGDAIDDILIGAPWATRHDLMYVGESYVVFGRDIAQDGPFAAVFELAALLPDAGGDGSDGFVLEGFDQSGSVGRSVSAAGDVNGDGLDDLVISADSAVRRGQSYVVFGRDTAHVGNFPAVFPLSTLLPASGGDGSTGFVLNGIDQKDYAGKAVSDAGDFNGDAIGDLIIGAPGADHFGFGYVGESYVVFGRDTANTGDFPAVFPLSSLLPPAGGDGSEGVVLVGVDDHNWSGIAVRGAGDLDGDGFDDVVVGAYLADTGGRFAAGESYVVFGRATTTTSDAAAVAHADLAPPGRSR